MRRLASALLAALLGAGAPAVAGAAQLKTRVSPQNGSAGGIPAAPAPLSLSSPLSPAPGSLKLQAAPSPSAPAPLLPESTVPQLRKDSISPRNGVRVEIYDFGRGATANLVTYPDGFMELRPWGRGRGAEIYGFAEKTARERGLVLRSDALRSLSYGALQRWELMVAEGRAVFDAQSRRYVAVSAPAYRLPK